MKGRDRIVERREPQAVADADGFGAAAPAPGHAVDAAVRPAGFDLVRADHPHCLTVAERRIHRTGISEFRIEMMEVMMILGDGAPKLVS